MSRQDPPSRGYPPRGNAPPRASRHRSSVIGPPPGIEAGTGYQSPTQEYTFPQPPSQQPGSTPSTQARGRQLRPDPNVFDPILEEEPPTPPRRSSRRGLRSRGRDSSAIAADAPTMMFYPSTTTVSSMSSDSFIEPPMPFFRVDSLRVGGGARGPGSSPRSLPPMEEEDPRRRTTSTVSSGVLGPGTIEVDPDTEEDEEETESDVSSVYSSTEGQLVRNVSLVRRGQARIIRNPSARRSTIPEVSSRLRLF